MLISSWCHHSNLRRASWRFTYRVLYQLAGQRKANRPWRVYCVCTSLRSWEYARWGYSKLTTPTRCITASYLPISRGFVISLIRDIGLLKSCKISKRATEVRLKSGTNQARYNITPYIYPERIKITYYLIIVAHTPRYQEMHLSVSTIKPSPFTHLFIPYTPCPPHNSFLLSFALAFGAALWI